MYLLSVNQLIADSWALRVPKLGQGYDLRSTPYTTTAWLKQYSNLGGPQVHLGDGLGMWMVEQYRGVEACTQSKETRYFCLGGHTNLYITYDTETPRRHFLIRKVEVGWFLLRF
jgi:hypothetical protein